MVTDLGHAAFSVRDVEGSIGFYSKLGLREAFRLHHDDGSLMLVYLHVAGDRFLELFPGGTQEMQSSDQSFRHVCLVVDDIEATLESLRSEGVGIDRDVSMGRDGNLQAWIHDPDGNVIELMQLSEESPQRRAARLSAGSEAR